MRQANGNYLQNITPHLSVVYRGKQLPAVELIPCTVICSASTDVAFQISQDQIQTLVLPRVQNKNDAGNRVKLIVQIRFGSHLK